jgi:hypothetical protein
LYCEKFEKEKFVKDGVINDKNIMEVIHQRLVRTLEGYNCNIKYQNQKFEKGKN